MESVNDFSNEIKNNNNIFIIKLGAEWCGPCKAIEPLVDKYFKMLIEKKINCQQIDVDEALDIFAFLKRKRVITGIPAILLYKKIMIHICQMIQYYRVIKMTLFSF